MFHKILSRAIVFVSGLFVIGLILIALIWSKAGLGEYYRYMRNISYLPEGDHRDEFTNRFFGGDRNHVKGGILAYVDNKMVWIWGRSYTLKSINYSNNTKFGWVENCTFDLQSTNFDKLANNTHDIRFRFVERLSDWMDKSNIGKHVFVYTNLANDAEYVVVSNDVSLNGAEPVFCLMYNGVGL